MRSATWVLPMFLACAAIARAEPTAADRESARAAFTLANKLRDAGDVRGALEKYKAAYALAPTPVTALEVGRAETDLGQLVEAREVLLRVESMDAAGESAKSRAARREAADLAQKLVRRIPKLVLRVVGPADGVAISVDGVSIPREALAVPRALDPGAHAVLAMAGGRVVQQSVELREGETREASLDVTSLAPRGPVAPIVTPIAPIAPGGGLVAFNTNDNDHAWTLRDPRGRVVCRLPCAQSLGFANGYVVERDDGARVEVPSGLAPLPGSTAQVQAYGPGGSVVTGWILVGIGIAAVIASVPVILATASNFGTDATGPIAFGVLIGGGSLVGTVGAYVLALSHGPMLVRTDMGMPMRVAGPTLRFGLNGISGTF